MASCDGSDLIFEGALGGAVAIKAGIDSTLAIVTKAAQNVPIKINASRS